MNVRVDEEVCVGCGTCADMCPEIFEMQGDIAAAKITAIPDNLQEACREAAEACPVEAIIVEE